MNVYAVIHKQFIVEHRGYLFICELIQLVPECLGYFPEI